MMSDAELLGSVGRGDVGAFEQLYDRYAGVVLAVAERTVGRDAAHDVVVDAFLELRAARTTPLGRPGPKPVLRWLVERVVDRSKRHPS